ncbi:MAG: nucleotide exchange factor GrpE [Gemmatimonadota bacterium]|nr:nucleotide exchange factor GrpE [Gemmatimonadota bacterium]
MSEREVPIEESDAPADRPGEDAVATEVSGQARAGEESAEEVREEIDGLRDRLLRLQAEFDNFRKREARERAAAWARAKADLSQKLLAAIDDLQRFASLDPEQTDTETVVEGVGMVERKILETLEREGLAPIGEVGEPFDPNVHEAISVLPSSSPEDDGTVAHVVSLGYQFGEQLLRPARVQVYEHRPA